MKKEAVLKQYPYIPTDAKLGIFLFFLWDDPLFTEEVGDPQEYVCDPEFIELRRALRLSSLELLYIRIAVLEKDLDDEKAYHREAQAREAWTIKEFLKVIPHELSEPILINRKVNDMDKDFSFEKAIGAPPGETP